MKCLFVKSCLLGALLLSGVGCSSKKDDHKNLSGKKDKTIKINIVSEPQTLDPRKVRSLVDTNISKMLMEGLTRIDLSGKASLALAKTVTLSEDEMTYTFVLKETQWSNKEPVTAHDFVYAWKSILDPKYPSDSAFNLYPIKNAQAVKAGTLPPSMLGIETPNAQTLIVHLEHKSPHFLEALAMPVFFPVPSALDRANPSWPLESETFVSNGPYKMESWHHNYSICAVKNPLYWDKENVKTPKISMAMVGTDTGYKMFESSTLHWEGSPLGSIPIDAIAALKSANKLHYHPFSGTCWILTNINAPPFNSKKIRQAFSLAIDRESIVEHIMQGDQKVAHGIIPPNTKIPIESPFAANNKEIALQLFTEALAETGFTRETLPLITITYAQSGRTRSVLQVIQEQWKAIFGIAVQLQSIENKVLLNAAISKGNYQLAYGDWIADNNDPINFLQIFQSKSTGTNNTGWENITYANLVQQASNEKDTELRKGLLAKAQDILMEELPVLPLFHHNMLYVKDNDLKDVLLTDTGGIDFKWAYLE